MTITTLTLTEFLLSRIAEDEAWARLAQDSSDRAPWHQGMGPFKTKVISHAGLGVAEAGKRNVARFISMHDPVRVLAECEAKRRIIALHESWPVLAHTQPTFDSADDVTGVALRMSQQIIWQTEQEYRARFGDEPPTAPMLRALAAIYSDHPDYRSEWAV